MATLLEREQVDTLRGVKNVAAVWLVMQMIDRRYPGRAVTVEEIAGLLEMDKRTVEKQVGSLCFSNRAVKHGRGFVLTEGRALLLQAQDEAQDSQALAQQDLQGAGKNIHKVCVSPKKKEEDDVNLILDSSSSNLKSAQNLQNSDEPTTRQILEAAEMLFENGVTLTGLQLDAINPLLALGWVAQAYSQKDGLYNAAGLVYKRLADPTSPKPQAKYFHEPTKYLPHEYLVQVGLAFPMEEIAEADEADEEMPAFEPDPDLVPMWSSVLLQIRGREEKSIELARHDTWFADSFPVSRRGNRLVVAFRNAYAVEQARLHAAMFEHHAGMPIDFVIGGGYA